MGVPERNFTETDAWGNPVKPVSKISALWAALFSFLALLTFVCILVGYSESRRKNFVRLFELAEEVRAEALEAEAEESFYDFLATHKEELSKGPDTLLTSDPYDFYEENFYYYDEYIDESVPYSVYRCVWEYCNPDGKAYREAGGFPNDFYTSCEYLKVSNTGLKPEAEAYLNDILYVNTCIGSDMYYMFAGKIPEDKAFYSQVSTNVAYMNEDVFSVIMTFDGYVIGDIASIDDGDYVSAGMLAFNFDMKTGKLIDIYDYLTPDNDFVDWFFDSAMEQTGEDVSEYITKEEVLSDLKKGYLEWFYTPIGIEFGYNYPGFYGYTSVTSFDRDIFDN